MKYIYTQSELIMKASIKSIQEIFNKSWNLTIPFFQRPYIWDEEEWDRFLSDMYDICQYKEPYFLGSIILKRESEQSKHCIVVDGQQRLTTLVLLFKVLSLKHNKLQEFDFYFKTLDENKSILIHNKNDRKSFETILNLGLLQVIDNPINQIERCYNYFINSLDEEKLSFSDLLKYIELVSIELDYNENEKQIFDTINSLGIRLSDSELLKSQFFRSNEEALYTRYWQRIFEQDSETFDYWHNSTHNKEGKTLSDVLLFLFLQLKAKELPQVKRGGFGQISNLLKSYQKLMPAIENKSTFFDELEQYANIFRRYINPNISQERIVSQIDRINLIIFEGNLFSIIPYVVFLLIKLEHNQEELNKTLFVLESYLMRRMVGIEKGTLIAKDYAELFGTRLIHSDIASANALKIHLNGYKSHQLSFIPKDTDIKLWLKSKAPVQAKAKLIFYLLENKLRQNNNAEVLLTFETYSVEYLMPKQWQKNWEQPIDKSMREIAIKTLGNTTIVAQKLSHSLKDANWQARLNGTNKAKGLLANHHIELNKVLLQKTSWTDNDIFANNERLAERICKTWNLS